MKILKQLLMAFGMQMPLVCRVLGIAAKGGLRGFSNSSQLTAEVMTEDGPSKDPRSCHIFAEMLGRAYYIRDQLGRTTDSLSSFGYQKGKEWVMDQGIGNVTPSTMEQVVCPLLAKATTPAENPAPENPADPAQENLADPADPKSHFLIQPNPAAEDPAPENPPPEKKTEEIHEWLPKLPGWLGGGDSAPQEMQKSPPAKSPDSKQGQDSKDNHLPVSEVEPSIGENVSTDEELSSPSIGDTSTPFAVCPTSSSQNSLLSELNSKFDGLEHDRENLDDIRHIYSDLILSIEHGVMSLYKYRGCPAVDEHEFKTQHVCQVHREAQATALRLMQAEVPAMRARLSALQSRLREIDKGSSQECFFTQTSTRMPTSGFSKPDLRRCLKLQAVIDALLDGRKGQKQWLKDMGAGMERLGSMALQLNGFIQDPVLKRDKIPLNALKALTNSWKALWSPTQQLRMMGSTRAKQAAEIDSVVLHLSSFLKNVSSQEGCTTESFGMRYSAQTCTSLRLQLNADAKERQADLHALLQQAKDIMQAASDGLISNKCTAPPVTQGCWLRLPSGCPNLPDWKSSDKWTRDVFGEQSAQAAESKEVCLVSRRMQMDSLCGVANTEMRFIPN